MYTNYNYLIPETRQAWRSATEIAMTALAHENRRIEMEEIEPCATQQDSGLLAFFGTAVQPLTAIQG